MQKLEGTQVNENYMRKPDIDTNLKPTMSSTLSVTPAVVPDQAQIPASEAANLLSLPAAHQEFIDAGRRGYRRTKVVTVEQDHLLKHRILIENAVNDVADSFRVLRTRILQRMRDRGWVTLAVTSPGGGEGKSITAINLAQSISRDGNYTVLLVEANFRRPVFAEVFGIELDYGLEDHFFSGMPLEKIMVNPSLPGLVLLPVKEPVTQSSELMTSQAMRAIVAEMKQRYANRVVIFDLPPLLTSDDALALSPLIDCNLLVVCEGKTRKSDYHYALELLDPERFIGAVANRAAVEH